MRTRKLLSTILLTLFGLIATYAQSITVTVSPVNDVLPPQLGLYYSSPDKFFSVSITNTGAVSEQVYLGMQIEQLSPSTSISITTPAKRQPLKPFVVAPNQTYQLSLYEMKHLFDYIPANEVTIPQQFLDGFMSNSYGLLPEGQYQLHFTAYQWVGGSNLNPNPVVVSNPANGKALFSVCYKAQPPRILTPVYVGVGDDSSIAEINEVSPLFTWSAPVVTCNPRANKYRYDLRIVRLMKDQSPDYALDHNPIFYQSKGLLVTQCMIPNHYVNQLVPGETYVAQVTATSAASSSILLDYATVENDGKSQYCLFRLPATIKPDSGKDAGEKKDDKSGDGKEDEKKTDDNKKDDVVKQGADDLNDEFLMGDVEFNDSIVEDSMYTFRNPQITSPTFFGGDNIRKMFTNNDIDVEFRKAWYVGGVGEKEDTIKIDYRIELFDGGLEADREAAFKTTPIYTSNPKDLKDKIAWDKIKDKITPGDYLVLRVTPSTKAKAVAFVNDSVNVIDFAMIDHVVKQYFQCSNTVEIANTTETKTKAEDFVGKTVAVGEYNLTIDKCSKSKKGNGFTGEGRVEWNPFGAKVMLCVSFDTLRINTDNVVFGGICKTVVAPEIPSAAVVDEVFSDFGLDEFMSSTGIPYASTVTNIGKNYVSNAIGKQAEIGKYYKDVQKGLAIKDWIMDGQMDNVKFPIALPASVSNLSPVNIQISSMTFAPQWATMNIVGEFQVPGSSWESDDVLMFGAPRVCISPNRILPESGTLALLSDFSVEDPKSGYKMTFNAPNDLLEPADGCYLSWHDDGFEMLGVDIDMKIPHLCKEGSDGKLVKDKEGNYELPNLKIVTSIGNEWNDWVVDNITMDPFQVEALPGYTFTANKIVVDHSIYRNAAAMGQFPAGYTNPAVAGNPTSWMGLYINDVTLKFPGALEFGDTEDTKRLTVSLENMFWDNTGATFDLGAGNVLSAKTGKAGGWAFSLDKICMRVIQDNFDQCYFNGKLEVPLLEGEIGYRCNIIRQMSGAKATGEYAYIFNTQQLDSLSMDLFLADVKFKKEQTYFLLESVPENGAQVTRVELLMSGVMEIGGTIKGSLQEKLDKLPMKPKIPDVHFTKMRLANCKPWQSRYEVSKSLQEAKVKVDGKEFVSDKEYALIEDKLFFSRGAWSLASLEKKIGPFKFGIDDYTIGLGSTDTGGKTLDLGIVGTVGVLDGLIDAKGALTIKTEIKGVSKALSGDFSALGFAYDETRFDSLVVDCKMTGLEMKGKIAFIYPEDGKYEKGFSGDLKIALPQDIFAVEASGGFYNHEEENNEFKWGFFRMKVAAPVPLGPVQLSNIKGGFYFNCKPEKPEDDNCEVIASKGVIGINAGLGLAMAGSPETVNGNMGLTITYNTQKSCFSCISINGDVHAICQAGNLDKGLINGKASLVYQNDDTDRFLQISITADAAVDADPAQFAALTGVDVGSFIQDYADQMQEFDASNDDTAKDNQCKSETKGSKAKVSAGFHISLDMRFELPMEGRAKSKCKWHVYLGEPGSQEDVDNGNFDGKRCSITFFDFQVGGKNDPIAVWAKAWANGYICLGNELPNNGNLPGIPSEIKKFLDGDDVNGNKQNLSGTADSKRQSVLSKMETKGGIMLGAAVGGGFGCNAVIAYCDVAATVGFDVILKKVSGESCRGTSHEPGKNGWYATGQAYGYIKGEVGLMLNLWIVKGKVPLIDAELGMLLQAGLPNPTWFYGKARARCKLFGGLVKFNQSIEVKAGEVCEMEMANPLEDVNVFGDTTPEAETPDEGWTGNERSSIYMKPRFATNMKMNQALRLVSADADSDAKSQTIYARTYKFVFVTNPVIKQYSKADTNSVAQTYSVPCESSNYDNENWTLETRTFKPMSYYAFSVTAKAMELKAGKWGNPWFTESGREVQKPWSQTITRYFQTGERPDHLVDEDIAIAIPGTVSIGGKEEDSYHVCSALYKREAESPFIVMNESRADLIPDGYSLRARMEKKLANGEWETIGELPAKEYNNLDSPWHCVIWAVDDPVSRNAYNPAKFKYNFLPGDNYRFSFLRRDEKKFAAYMMNAETKTTSKTARKMTTREKALANRQKTQLQKSLDSDDENLNLTDYMSALELENSLEEAEVKQETTVKELSANQSDADYYKVLYVQEFRMIYETINGITSFKQHAESLASKGYRAADGKKYTGSNAVVKYLDETKSRKYATHVTYLITSDEDNDPYYNICTKWGAWNFIAGFTIPEFDYFSDKVLNSEGLFINFDKRLYDANGTFKVATEFVRTMHGNSAQLRPQFQQNYIGETMPRKDLNPLAPFFTINNPTRQFKEWNAGNSISKVSVPNAIRMMLRCEAYDVSYFFKSLNLIAEDFSASNGKDWTNVFMGQTFTSAYSYWKKGSTIYKEKADDKVVGYRNSISCQAYQIPLLCALYNKKGESKWNKPAYLYNALHYQRAGVGDKNFNRRYSQSTDIYKSLQTVSYDADKWLKSVKIGIQVGVPWAYDQFNDQVWLNDSYKMDLNY